MNQYTYEGEYVRAIGVVALKVWHDLPDSIRSSDSISIISFKKNMKTYLFNETFTSWLATYSLQPVSGPSLNA